MTKKEQLFKIGRLAYIYQKSWDHLCEIVNTMNPTPISFLNRILRKIY